MRSLCYVLTFCAALVCAAPRADAVLISLQASIDGLQETPPVATPATGSASITFDTVSKLLSWTITYQDLVGTMTNAHFHGPAAPGVGPAAVVLGIPLSPGGATSGSFVGSATLTSGQETQLLAELWYINIHSTFKTGGEIRGQVVVVPEPATLALFASGIAGLAFAGRRRALWTGPAR